MTQKRLCACRPMSGRGRGRGVCVGVCVGVVSPFALPSHVRGVLLCRHRVDVDSGRALPVVADGLGRTLANGGCRQRARFAQLCGRNATGVHTQRDRPLDHRPLPARARWLVSCALAGSLGFGRLRQRDLRIERLMRLRPRHPVRARC